MTNKLMLTLSLCLFANIASADVVDTRGELSNTFNNTVKELKEIFFKTQEELKGTEQSTTETREVAKELYERSKEEEQNPTVLTHGRKNVANCNDKSELLIWKDNTWQCEPAPVGKDCDPAADEYEYEDANGNTVCSKSEKGKGLDYYWKFRGYSEKCANVNEGKLKLYDCYYKNKQGVEIQVADSKCSNEPKPNAAKVLCTANWTVGGWGGCSKSCGGGTQTRSVVCPAGYDCSKYAKPTNSQRCNTHTCTTHWRTGAWGSCSARCEGVKTRSVWCPGGYHCPGAKPSTRSSCGGSCSSCPPGYQFYQGGCCKMGTNCSGGSQNSGNGGGGGGGR